MHQDWTHVAHIQQDCVHFVTFTWFTCTDWFLDDECWTESCSFRLAIYNRTMIAWFTFDHHMHVCTCTSSSCSHGLCDPHSHHLTWIISAHLHELYQSMSHTSGWHAPDWCTFNQHASGSCTLRHTFKCACTRIAYTGIKYTWIMCPRIMSTWLIFTRITRWVYSHLDCQVFHSLCT